MFARVGLNVLPRASTRGVLNTHINRYICRTFHTTKPSLLLYQPKPKTADKPEEKKHKEEPVLTPTQLEDMEKERRLMKNKYYVKTPKFLRPYMRELMLRPVGFGASVVILHQFAAVVPFLLLWQAFFQTGHIPDNLPAEFFDKGLEIISKGMVNLDMDAESKAKLAAAGAASYALVRSLNPLRLPLCFALAPWFDKWCIRPLGRIFSGMFKKNVVVKPRQNQ